MKLSLLPLLCRAVLQCCLLTLLAALAPAAVTITADPLPVTRVAGHYAVFTVQATGTGTLSYQWRKNGSNIPGATQQGLVLNSLSAGDAANYSVVVSNADPSSAISASAALTVNTPQPGDLDFSLGGSSINDDVSAMALQSDGKVVIAGKFTSVHGAVRSRIARLNTDGTTDLSFGDGLAGADGNVNAVAVQSDGKVVIGGAFSSVHGTARGRIARLNSDGSLDTSFGNGLAGTNNIVHSVAVQSDGKVLIGGLFTLINGTARNWIARLNSNGTLDTGFGSGLAGAGGQVNAVAVQTDGRVIIGGTFASVDGTARGRIARLNSDGTLDTSFGNGLAGTNNHVLTVAVQSDGKVLIGGTFTSVHGTARGRIARMNSDGTLDTSFGNGLAGAAGNILSVAVQGDGKVLIGGEFVQINGVVRNRMARLNSNGTLDTSFGHELGGVSNWSVNAVALQSDGKVLIGGDFAMVNGTTVNRIARLNGDGSLNTGFVHALAGLDLGVRAIAVQSDGKVVIGGVFTMINGVARNRVARLNRNGTVDTSFANIQIATNAVIYALAVQSDGKVLIGGTFPSINGTARGQIARLNNDGTLDAGFGNGLAGTNNNVLTVAVQSDGKVIIGGNFTSINGTARNRIARLNGDGTLDTSFGNGLTGVSAAVNTVAIQSDGKVFIGGDFSSVYGVARGRIARLNSDGTLDTGFGNGLAGLNVGTGVESLAVQSDGKVLLGGSFTTVHGTARGRIARLNSNGTLDTGFGNGLTGANSTVFAVAVQSDSKVLIGGDFSSMNSLQARHHYARLFGDNTAPTDIALSPASLGQNNPPNTPVGTLAATDSAGDTHTFTLVSGAGDVDNGSFTIAGSTLRLTPVADYETKNSYALRVRATDQCGLSYEKALTVAITPNLPPIFTGFAVSTPMNTAKSVSKADLLTRASDPDGGTPAVSGVFSASSQGGTVGISAIDAIYMPPTGFTGLDTFDVTITDGQGGSTVGTVTVHVTSGSGPGLTNDQPIMTIQPNSHVALLFAGIPGNGYEVQRSTDLQNWTTLQTLVAAPDGTLPFTDTTPPPGRAFYRRKSP